MGRSGWYPRAVRAVVTSVISLAFVAGIAIALMEHRLGAFDDKVVELHEGARFEEATLVAKRYADFGSWAYGDQSAHFAKATYWLGALYQARMRFHEAEPFFKRYVDMAERLYGRDSERYATALGWLGHLYQDQGRYNEAEPLLQTSLDINEKMFGPEHLNVGRALNTLAHLYNAQARHRAAEPLQLRDLAIREKLLGADHPDVAVTLNNLAELYSAQARYSEAEAVHRRALAIRATKLAPNHQERWLSLNNLAEVLSKQGGYAEAEQLRKGATDYFEKAHGSSHPLVAVMLNNLAALYSAQGRYSEAESLHRRALSIRQTALGADHLDVAASLNNLAEILTRQGRYSEAVDLHARSLAVRQRTLGSYHPNVALALQNYASVHEHLARYSEAERMLKQAIDIYEQTLGSSHPDVATSINNLAQLYYAQNRYADAEALQKRALSIREGAFGSGHRDVAVSLNNLGIIYQGLGRHHEAEALHRRALVIRESTLGPGHPDVALSLNNLATVFEHQGRLQEAETLHQKSLAITQEALGPEHYLVGTALNNIGLLKIHQGRYDEAKGLLQRSHQIREKSVGGDHPSVRIPLLNLAWLYIAQEKWGEAEGVLRQGVDISIRRTRHGSHASGQARQFYMDTASDSSAFSALIKAAWRLAAADAPRAQTLLGETFAAAQWARASETAATVAEMAARSAKKKPGLASVIRERQDLIREWRAHDQYLVAELKKPERLRSHAAEGEQRARLSQIDVRLAEIDKMLARDFPEFAAVASLEPLSLAEVQRFLGSDEALVLFLDTQELTPMSEETFIWIVSKTSARWLRIDLGTKGLTQRIRALRCGLDRTAWHGPSASLCSDHFQMPPAHVPNVHDQPPYDFKLAAELYHTLFHEAEDLIRDKHLLVVPSGPLTHFPLHALITEPLQLNHSHPESAYRKAAWLGRRQPITVLPSVSSLKALRQNASASFATKPFVGFGNPLLRGDPGNAEDTDAASLAAKITGCEGHSELGSTVRGRAVGTRRQRGRHITELDNLRTQAPLPETAQELCTVAASLGASGTDVYLGPRATEATIKAASESGDLARYRIVHFATHAAVAGQIMGMGEPGVILTPPATSSPEDDGYLSASEIAGLKLDADWVILSACNTAAGDGHGVEALSGLARAFFYAQARALLVSHWEVDNEATVALITVALRELAADKMLGRAEAMRRSMVAMIDNGKLQHAHPAFWAPFVVVGEGARR